MLLLLPKSNNVYSLKNCKTANFFQFHDLKFVCRITLLFLISVHCTVLHLFTQVLFCTGNQGNHQNFDILANQETLNDFNEDEAKMAVSKKLSFSKSPILHIFSRKFQGLVLGSVGYIDAKGIDVAQPIWLSGCPT